MSSSNQDKKDDFDYLLNEVIEPGYCVSCGGCEAVCPIYVISIVDDKPELVGTCIPCSACVDICLRIKQREEQKDYVEGDLGSILRVYKGKTKSEYIAKVAQNGGFVTTLLSVAFEGQLIDAAVLTGKTKNPLNPTPTFALDVETIIRSSGSKYTLSYVLQKMYAVKSSDKNKVAVVGLPCHLETLTNMMDEKLLGTDVRVKYKIGLFCMGSYNKSNFEKVIKEKSGVNLSSIQKIDCARGKFFFETKEGIKEVKIGEFNKKAKAEGCKYCKDFTAVYSDISVGNVGVEDTENIVIVRTENGQNLLDIVIDKDIFDFIEVPEEEWDDVLAGAIRLDKIKKKSAKDLPELNR